MGVDREDEPDPLVADLLDEINSSLRTVTIYGEQSYEMLYVRDTIEAAYSPAEFDIIFDELRMEGWGRQRLDDIFDAGSLDWSIYGFEEAMMLHFVINGFEGVFVTYDRDTGIDVEDVVATCKTHL